MGKTTQALIQWLSRREAIRLNRVTGETPDPTPVHIPGKSNAPLTLREEMRRYVRDELSKHATDTGDETFEESNDFSEEDQDADLLTAYTVVDLLPEDQAPTDELEGAPTDEDQAVTPAEPPLTAEPSENPPPPAESP